MEAIDKKDIQAIILKGYGKLPSAAFVLLSFTDPGAAKNWLGGLKVTPGNVSPTEDAINLSLTFKGLKALGLPQHLLHQFPLELEDGMTTDHKRQFLGDYGKSDYRNWEWGNDKEEELHAILMLYAKDDQHLDILYNQYQSAFAASGIREIRKQDSQPLPGIKEHFGFRDGIAQPTIAGLARKDIPANTVAAGEFILGYENEYDQYTRRPILSAAEPHARELPANPEATDTFDLGRNGSYMVYRQITQDVKAFWQYMDQSSGGGQGEEMVRLASKMMGRWPGGAPLALSPDKDDPQLATADRFGYRDDDANGSRCPFASHVRRTNPRDDVDDNRRVALKTAKKHRILRRGRTFGPPADPSMEPQALLNANSDDQQRGLHFICFNADINRQFEFIQNVWVNNPKFAGLYDERDPVIGNHSHPDDPEPTGNFTIPTGGLKERYSGIPEFTTVIGGAYFFTPGLRALKYLSKI